MENKYLFKNYFWKEKRPVNVYVHKSYDGPFALIEKGAYSLIKDLEVNVPDVHSNSLNNLLVIRYIDGISVFKLLVELDKISKTHPKLKEKALNVKMIILNKIFNDTVKIQEINSDYSKKLKDFVQKYSYTKKSKEVIELFRTNFKFKCNIELAIKEIIKICEYSDGESVYHFRDATPKNMILDDYKLKCGIGYIIECLKNDVFNEDYFKTKLFHIDMRSMHELVLKEDDYISFLWHYCITDQEREQFNISNSYNLGEAMFCRGIRFYGRRLAYFLSDYSLFKKRYAGENMQFYYDMMIKALRLIRMPCPNLLELFEELKENELHKKFTAETEV